jgi:putative hydrolase of the HAD superfamily
MEPHPSVGHVYAHVAARFGLKIKPENVNQRFKTVWKARGGLKTLLPIHGFSLYEIEITWWKRFVEEVMEPFRMGCYFNEFFENLYVVFEQGDSWRVFPDVKETLLNLKKMGFRLGVISNWDSRLIPLLKTMDLSRFFDKIVVSSQAGMAKPDPAIFKEAARRVECRDEECLHVGDSVEEDYLAALGAGFSAVLLNRVGKHQSGHRQIGSLNELLETAVI